MLQLLHRLFQHQFCNPRDQLLWQIQQRHRLSKSANQQECSSRIYSNISWRDNNCFLFENILKSSKISSSFFAFGQDCKINVMSISESFCFVKYFFVLFPFFESLLTLQSCHEKSQQHVSVDNHKHRNPMHQE